MTEKTLTPNSSPLTPHIAVTGVGYWGKNLVRNFHQLGVLKTICDQSSAIRQQMANDYPDTLVTDDFNALLAGNRGHDAASCPPIPSPGRPAPSPGHAGPRCR